MISILLERNQFSNTHNDVNQGRNEYNFTRNFPRQNMVFWTYLKKCCNSILNSVQMLLFFYKTKYLTKLEMQTWSEELPQK